ncbi:hypothetical protein [Pseudonocardia sp. KRD291]|uniref:hypothetical protein n=1 Tax=Pseudonocardia sp. KRD291 TaxID=2792007 RepID=UPI001C4A6ED9|nr:hypothetical protein [Pseudonocardia sp. KRD291]MBW0102205.1 hypothetical protein [Pseudonocardia sp. KRD291]
MTPGPGSARAAAALAVARMLGEDIARSQRFLVPGLLFGVVLAVLFGGDPGALPEPWAASALLLYPVGAWLTHSVAGTEDDVARTVTVTAAGGGGPVVAGVALAGAAGVAVLSVLAVLWGLVAGFSTATPGILIEGLFGHLACGLSGVAVGLVCARPVIRSLGRALLAGLAFVVVTGTRSWLPPVGTAVAALGSGRGGVGVFGDVLLAMALVVGAAALVVRCEQGWPDEWGDRLEPVRRRLPRAVRDRFWPE